MHKHVSMLPTKHQAKQLEKGIICLSTTTQKKPNIYLSTERTKKTHGHSLDLKTKSRSMFRVCFICVKNALQGSAIYVARITQEMNACPLNLLTQKC